MKKKYNDNFNEASWVSFFLKKTRYDLRLKLVLVVVLVLENKTDSVRFDINLRASSNLMMLRSVSDRKVPQLGG